ncbi:sterol desaturase family protein [Saprospiraceae bacterium]|nr:sterol desaturase family protein [Saprospiraceae bacterium]
MKTKLSPGHEILSNKDESIPLFGNGFLDIFSRVAWYVPPIIFVPVIAYFIYISFTIYNFSVGKFLLLLVAGFFVWSITEYLFHRFIFHHYPKSKLGRKLHFMMHGVHHAYPNDSMRLVMPPLMSVPLATAFYFLWSFLFGSLVAPFFAGFILGYLGYDMMHYATHHAKFLKADWFVNIKNHHMKHHYQDPDHGFGVTSDFWDKIFRTEIK